MFECILTSLAAICPWHMREASHGVRAVVIGGYATPTSIRHTTHYTAPPSVRHTTHDHTTHYATPSSIHTLHRATLCHTIHCTPSQPYVTIIQAGLCCVFRNMFCRPQCCCSGGRFPGTSVSFYWQMAVSSRDTQWQFHSHKCTLRE